MSILRDIWDNINRKQILTISAFLAFILIAEIVLTSLVPAWRNFFYNQLALKSLSGFQWGILYLVMLHGFLSSAQGIKTWVGQKLSLHVRTSVSNILERKWIKEGDRGRVDFADQRIAEDCKLATDLTIKVFVEVIISSAIVVTLVLSSLGQPMLLVASLVYTSGVVALALLFRKPLIAREIAMQKAEAGYRFDLAKLVMQKDAGVNLNNSFSYVKIAYNSFIALTMRYALFNKIQGGIMSIVPFLILVPAYFAGDIPLGSVMAGVALFDLIVMNATILVLLYPEVTKAQASWYRIKEFYDDLGRN